MVPPIVIVFMLNLIRVFQSFETELLLGTPFGFFNYASMIFRMIRMTQPADFGAASAMGSITLIVIAIVIPLQRWLTQRRRYQTVTGHMRTGLIDLGRARYPVFGAVLFVVALLTIIPLFTMVTATFMVRAGFWYSTPLFTTDHWSSLFSDTLFWDGLKTTLILGLSTGLLSPFLFSVMGYVIARTSWRGRLTLDGIIWISSAVPGMLSGLGLMWMFLGVPFFRPLYGTIVPLILVVVLGGKLIGVQLSKAVFLQMGQDLEEAARVSGAGWIRAYVRIWIPLLAPTLALLGVINFVMAAGITSSIILLTAGRTTTLSILALEWARDGLLEVASAYNLIIVLLTVGVALVARAFGLRVGMTHSV
jgi:iron(III) transport system permease protein